MPILTEQQLISNGFERVRGEGQRPQIWTGLDANSQSVMIAWDSVTGRNKRFTNPTAIDILQWVMTLMVVVDALIVASTLSVANKTLARQALVDALQED